MRDIVDALAAQQAELTALLDGLDEAGWARPSPCEGWDVADVVLHLTQTNDMAVASLEGRLDGPLQELLDTMSAANVDEGAGIGVELARGDDGPTLLRRWRDGAAQLIDLFRAADPHVRVTWVVGQLSVHTLATTRLAETWVHTTDVAGALGVELAPTGRLEHIARLAWRTLPYAFERDGRALSGSVAFELIGPAGEPWTFRPDEPAVTTVRGTAADLCAVAGRRADASTTRLVADGPDAAAVLELVRTFA